jgi:hypothetical protein
MGTLVGERITPRSWHPERQISASLDVSSAYLVCTGVTPAVLGTKD